MPAQSIMLSDKQNILIMLTFFNESQKSLPASIERQLRNSTTLKKWKTCFTFPVA